MLYKNAVLLKHFLHKVIKQGFPTRVGYFLTFKFLNMIGYPDGTVGTNGTDYDRK